MPSVAVIIIGDEILTGKFADDNGPFLIRRLRALGADLMRLVTIRDSVEGIAREVAACAEAFDLVITTGGVGPTHDDMTLEGVARAFGRPMEQHPELIALLERFGMELNPAALRMATVPTGSSLVGREASGYPVLQVDNVYVFPGVPKLMRAKFEAIADRFAGETVLTARVYTSQRETEIAGLLGEVQARYPEVAIGSYPRYDEGNRHVIVTLEGRDGASLAEAEAALRKVLTTLPVGTP